MATVRPPTPQRLTTCRSAKKSQKERERTTLGIKYPIAEDREGGEKSCLGARWVSRTCESHSWLSRGGYRKRSSRSSGPSGNAIMRVHSSSPIFPYSKQKTKGRSSRTPMRNVDVYGRRDAWQPRREQSEGRELIWNRSFSNIP